MRPLLCLPGLVLALLVPAAGCGDASSSSSSNSAVPPSNCTAPCTVGDVCFGPAEPVCNGTWYCQSSRTWACSPPDAGGAGGYPDGFDGTLNDDGPDDATGTSDAPNDAPADRKTGKDE